MESRFKSQGENMLKQLYRILVSCACLLFGCSLANAYDYPFTDRYVATVVGTPAEYAEVLPTDMPTRTDTIKMFPERKIPGVVYGTWTHSIIHTTGRTGRHPLSSWLPVPERALRAPRCSICSRPSIMPDFTLSHCRHPPTRILLSRHPPAAYRVICRKTPPTSTMS
jgi:hypothetical protein